jgi:hypothetical protein
MSPTTLSVAGSISATSFVVRSVTKTRRAVASYCGVPVSLLNLIVFTITSLSTSITGNGLPQRVHDVRLFEGRRISDAVGLACCWQSFDNSK